MNRRRITAVVGLVTAAACLAADGPVRLGHYGSMSGDLSAFGNSTDRAIRLAVDQANAKGGVLGRTVEVFTEDDQSKNEQVLPALYALIDRKRVDVVLGEVASTLSLVGAPACQKRGVPMVTPSSVAADITRKGDYIFRACFLDVDQGRAAAVLARRDLKARRAALLVDQKSDYALGFARAFQELFERLGGRVVIKRTYVQGDKDFKAQLSAIDAAGPDVIAVPAMYADVPGMAQQARALGIKAPLVGGDGWDAEETRKYGGRNVEGYYFVTQYTPDSPDPAVKAFQAAYEKRYGEPPDGMAALGYDAANMVLDAIRRAGSTDKKAVRDALATTKDFPGVAGMITMGPDRNPSKSATVIQIRGGAFHLFTTIQPKDIERALAGAVGTAASTGDVRAGSVSIGQQLVNGLSIGAIYALIALGYTIVYGILRLINFAHGDVFMLGAVSVVGSAGVLAKVPGGPWAQGAAALALAMATGALAAFVLERVAYRPLRRPSSGWGLAACILVAFVLWALGLRSEPPNHPSVPLLGYLICALLLFMAAISFNGLAFWLGARPVGRMIPLITAIGASLLIEYTVQQPALFGNRPRGFPGELFGAASGHLAEPLRVGSVRIDRIDVAVLAATLGIVVLLTLLVRRTRWGLAMRAVSGNADAALLMGVNRDRVISGSFALGGALAGAAGVLWGLKYPQVDAFIGLMPGLKAFVAAVIGGIGSLPGAVVGGLVMGVSEAFLAASPLSQYKDALAFLLLIGILLVRPAGLLGRNVPEKV